MSVNILYYCNAGDNDQIFNNALTSLLSLRHNNTGKLSVFISFNNLSPEQIDTLDCLSSEDFTVSTFTLEIENVKGCPVPSNKFFHKIDSIRNIGIDGDLVYIDSDTIVRCDIRDFVNECKKTNKFLCGVHDYREPDEHRKDDYINAGILYIKDIGNFISRTNSVKDIQSKFDLSWMRFGDQDYLNTVFHGDIGNVSPEYNVMIPVYTGGSLQSINNFYYKQYTSKEEYLLSAKILHYSWNSKAHSERCPEWANTVYDMYFNLKSKYITHKQAKIDNKIKKILLGRKHRAFGDWIIFADVLHAINETYPEIQVDVEDNGNARLDILTECGCRYKLVSNPNPDDYDGHDPHVLYNTNPVTPNKHIIVSALENTCNKIPILNIRDFKSINLVSPVSIPEDYKVPAGNYVIVPHYYPPLVSSRVKDYSEENYNNLVSILTRAGYNVYELNSGNVEYRYIDSNKSFTDSKGVISANNIRETAKVLKLAHFCVLIENGMNHWACHNGARSYCIFKSPVHARPSSLAYNTLIPIECYENESPEYVFSEIMKHEEKR